MLTQRRPILPREPTVLQTVDAPYHQEMGEAQVFAVAAGVPSVPPQKPPPPPRLTAGGGEGYPSKDMQISSTQAGLTTRLDRPEELVSEVHEALPAKHLSISS